MDNKMYIDISCEIESAQSEDILFKHSKQQKFGFMEISSIYRNYPTLHFPEKPLTKLEAQSQQQNYNYLVHTMAEMMQKYAPDIQEMEV